jgi:hypothetical protein
MRYQVGTTGDEVEIDQYREVNKGVLKGSFSFIVYSKLPHIKAMKLIDCNYFVQSEKAWFNLPQKKIDPVNGGKSTYIPLISYIDKTYLKHLQEAVLQALKDIQPQEEQEGADGKDHQNHQTLQQPQSQSQAQTQAQIQSDQRKTDSLRASAPFNWGGTPF